MIIMIPLAIVAGILAWLLRPGKGLTSSRQLAILAATIPPAAVAITAVIFQVLQGKAEVSDVSNALFITGLGLIVAGILAAVGFAIGKRPGIAKGIGFGICISAILSIIEFGVLEWLAGL